MYTSVLSRYAIDTSVQIHHTQSEWIQKKEGKEKTFPITDQFYIRGCITGVKCACFIVMRCCCLSRAFKCSANRITSHFIYFFLFLLDARVHSFILIIVFIQKMVVKVTEIELNFILNKLRFRNVCLNWRVNFLRWFLPKYAGIVTTLL